MQNGTLTCLGVGDGAACPDRHHGAFHYEIGKTSLLLDCGEPVGGSLESRSRGGNSLDGILISHCHADHLGGFFMLMQGLWLAGRRKELPVYLPGRAIRPLRAMLKACLLFDELLKFRLRLKPLPTRKAVSVREVRATAFPTTHLDRLRARFRHKYQSAFSAYCFLLETKGLRLGHSADLGRPADLDPLLAKPLDLLVCELAHFTPEALFQYLRGHSIGHVVFVHLGRPYWENLDQTRRLAARRLPDIPHTFARDGAVIRF